MMAQSLIGARPPQAVLPSVGFDIRLGRVGAPRSAYCTV
jgi:hypothetical protein